MEDVGCPTCGSKKIVNLDVRIGVNGSSTRHNKCNNCKKSWLSN